VASSEIDQLELAVLRFTLFMPPPTIVDGEHYVIKLYVVQPFVFYPLSVYPSVPVLHDTISPYLVDGLQWNLAWLVITWVGIGGIVFTVKGQGRDQIN